MNDLQLKELLLETCPVRPGQEGRAWMALKDRLGAPAASPATSFFLRASRGLAFAALAILLALGIFALGVTMRPAHHGLAFADSQVPGIYATSFYSHSAQAQVVWLNGMDPVSDKLTYLDPTTRIKSGPTDDSQPAEKNSDRL